MKRIGKDFNEEQLSKIMRQIDEDGVYLLGYSLSIVDKDIAGDGTLDFEEFVKLMQSWNKNERSYDNQLKEAFNVFDKDGDGTITAKELNTVLQGLGLGSKIDKTIIDLMIEEVDQDGNGEIDFDGNILALSVFAKPELPCYDPEFKKMMTDGPQ